MSVHSVQSRIQPVSTGIYPRHDAKLSIIFSLVLLLPPSLRFPVVATYSSFSFSQDLPTCCLLSFSDGRNQFPEERQAVGSGCPRGHDVRGVRMSVGSGCPRGQNVHGVRMSEGSGCPTVGVGGLTVERVTVIANGD